MKKEKSFAIEFVFIILIAIGVLTSVYFVVKAGSWFFSDSVDEVDEVEVGSSLEEQFSIIDHQISELTCEIRKGELLGTRGLLNGEFRYVGDDFYGRCFKEGVSYEWKNGAWMNENKETKILE